MRKSKWSWDFTKGMGWAFPAAAGALFGIKDSLMNPASFPGALLIVVGATGLSLWLGGLRRINEEEDREQTNIRTRVANMEDMKAPKRPMEK